MGAQFIDKNTPVININGDGGVLMNTLRASNHKRNNLPLITIILNNKFLGMVRQWQSIL